jgi:hypothetical protein
VWTGPPRSLADHDLSRGVSHPTLRIVEVPDADESLTVGLDKGLRPWFAGPELGASEKMTRHASYSTATRSVRLTSGVSGERSEAERVHCTPGLGHRGTAPVENVDGRVFEEEFESFKVVSVTKANL